VLFRSQLEEWNADRPLRDLQVAVNVSGRHISKARIRRDVASALSGHAVDPGQLVLEVTETALMDGSVAAENLEVLRELGVVVSLDDFGTGYQSSTQLVRLPIDVLKIDRHFVDASSGTSRTLLELMVKAAHVFGVRVVAEGVEHRAQLDLVRRLGCEYAQGYYLGMPEPAERIHLADQATQLTDLNEDLAG
jgi:EAL domain-containing protein (putative c-di-GMP-specific phosphodiesterase class I)